MIKYLLLFAYLLNFNFVLGQIKDFKIYQEKINIAELNICKEKKLEAIRNYKDIFEDFKTPFCKDIYNSLLLCSEMDDEESFFYFLDYLLLKNLDSSIINKIEAFDKFKHLSKWEKFVKENNRKGRINDSLKLKVDSLQYRDQILRIKDPSYLKYRDTIKVLDSLNMSIIFDLIYHDNFPGENDIGTNSIIGTQGYDVVFLHYFQQLSNRNTHYYDKLVPMIIYLTQRGLIAPNKSAIFLSFNNSGFYLGRNITKYKTSNTETTYLIDKNTDKSIAMAKICSDLLYLESLDDYFIKAKFLLNNENDVTHKYDFGLIIERNSVSEQFLNMIIKTKREL